MDSAGAVLVCLGLRISRQGPHREGPETRRQVQGAASCPPLGSTPFRVRPCARSLLWCRSPGREAGGGCPRSQRPRRLVHQLQAATSPSQPTKPAVPHVGFTCRPSQSTVHRARWRTMAARTWSAMRLKPTAPRSLGGVGVHEVRIEGSERRRRRKPPAPARFASERSGDGAAKWRCEPGDAPDARPGARNSSSPDARRRSRCPCRPGGEPDRGRRRERRCGRPEGRSASRGGLCGPSCRGRERHRRGLATVLLDSRAGEAESGRLCASEHGGSTASDQPAREYVPRTPRAGQRVHENREARR